MTTEPQGWLLRYKPALESMSYIFAIAGVLVACYTAFFGQKEQPKGGSNATQVQSGSTDPTGTRFSDNKAPSKDGHSGQQVQSVAEQIRSPENMVAIVNDIQPAAPMLATPAPEKIETKRKTPPIGLARLLCEQGSFVVDIPADRLDNYRFKPVYGQHRVNVTNCNVSSGRFDTIMAGTRDLTLREHRVSIAGEGSAGSYSFSASFKIAGGQETITCNIGARNIVERSFTAVLNCNEGYNSFEPREAYVEI